MLTKIWLFIKRDPLRRGVALAFALFLYLHLHFQLTAEHRLVRVRVPVALMLAPGLQEFGEDPEIDRLIRKYGYKGTPNTLKMVAENEDLRNNLGAAAHLIHGSSEGRFTITYCPGDKITADEIRSVGFEYGDLKEMMEKYDFANLKDGVNVVNGEEIFYISNPALGLWALKSAFSE